jgi:hypothetical protein
VNADLLVVSTRSEAQLDCSSADRHLLWQEVAAIEVLAIRGDRVDLPCPVLAVNQTIRSSPAAPCTDHDNVTLLDGPLALHTKQPRPQIEYEVVPLISERLEDTRAELQRLENDCLLGQHASLIRRQHGQHSTRSIGRTVAQPGDVSV